MGFLLSCGTKIVSVYSLEKNSSRKIIILMEYFRGYIFISLYNKYYEKYPYIPVASAREPNLEHTSNY